MNLKIISFNILIFILSFEVSAQRKKVVYLDTLGNNIDWDSSIGIQNTGRYKLFWDESNEKIRYIVPIPTSKTEYDSLLKSTENRFTLNKVIGTIFEYPNVTDINGVNYSANNLKGKILIVNFWFVGCRPCEVEMPELNKLYGKYSNNEEVIFLSFAKSKESKVVKFLKNTVFNYPVVIMPDDLVHKYQIEAYPTNFIIDRKGYYHFASEGIGIGGITILESKLKKIL